jgi:glycosyltransferase involved in cell wall biosynthesis
VTPHYGVHLLVEAVARAVEQGVDMQLEIIGAGDSVPNLEARVGALGLSDRVTIEGRYLPHKTVLDRVNGASVGVIPNLPTPLNRFALSSKLFEYVALGVPVISAALPTIQEYFSDDEVQFFEPGSVASLADALLEVACDPESSGSRAQRARYRYDRYRWESNGQAYVAILERLSSGKEPSATGNPRLGHGDHAS